MLPKEQRLRNTRDYKRVYQKGSFFSASLFNLNFLKNRTVTSRIGIVINKKVEPKAVNRNKLKRQFREVARKLYPSLPKGYDVVITIKEKAKKADFKEIEQELNQALSRVEK